VEAVVVEEVKIAKAVNLVQVQEECSVNFKEENLRLFLLKSLKRSIKIKKVLG
jgi:hypothetical protein